MAIPRRDFLVSALAGLAATRLSRADETSSAQERSQWKEELGRHRIRDVQFKSVQMKWPRQVGKNARVGVHGFGPSVRVCQLWTDRGASGWGAVRGPSAVAERQQDQVKGRTVAELFDPAVGVRDGLAAFDFALHDLAGVILDLPVYKLLGAHGPTTAPCYSGMIYFDDLEPPESPAGISVVLQNCQADYDLGYRQLKVKIGRGNKWMPKAEGIRRDVEVTRTIAANFPDVEILVDGNDGFTPDEMIQYLDGIGDLDLFWIEEPFHERVDGYAALRRWLEEHDRETLLADGEARPDWDVLNELARRQLLDVQLVDILGYGFTAWRALMPKLKEQKVLASPHAWGSLLKTYYVSHLTAGLGNVVTIEGVTCTSDEVDFGDYRLQDGQLTVSDAPGFGMKLTGNA